MARGREDGDMVRLRSTQVGAQVNLSQGVWARTGPIRSYQHKSHYGSRKDAWGKCGMVHIWPSLGWGRKIQSATGTHGIDPASSRTHRPLPWCTLERRRPRRSRNTRSHHRCHRSRSHAHRPHRRRWGPPRKKTSVRPGPTLPSEGLELRTMNLAQLQSG